jgi:hypothetical protein
VDRSTDESFPDERTRPLGRDSVGRQVDPIGVRRERDVDAVVHQELDAGRTASGREPLRAPVEPSGIEILLAELQRSRAGGKNRLERAPFLGRERLARRRGREAGAVGDDVERRIEGRPRGQSSIPSIGLDAVA